MSFGDYLVVARVLFCFAVTATAVGLFIVSTRKAQRATPRTVLTLCIVMAGLGLVFGIGDGKFAFAGASFSSGPIKNLRKQVVGATSATEMRQVEMDHSEGARQYADLILLRVKLRYQLRQIYGKRYGPLPDGQDAGFKELIVPLARDGTLKCDTSQQLWEVADKTHFAEWLNEATPDEEELANVTKLSNPLVSELSQVEDQLINHPQAKPTPPDRPCTLPPNPL